MFGRSGRDGKKSTCVCLFSTRSLKSKDVQPDLKNLLESKTCLRQKMCNLLESSFDPRDQAGFPCCSVCCGNKLDPNGYFLYSGRSRKRPSSKKVVKTPIRVRNDALLESTLGLWRKREAERQGLAFVGSETVLSNSRLLLVRDTVDELVTIRDIVAIIGISEELAGNLLAILNEYRLQRMHEIESDHSYCLEKQQ